MGLINVWHKYHRLVRFKKDVKMKEFKIKDRIGGMPRYLYVKKWLRARIDVFCSRLTSNPGKKDFRVWTQVDFESMMRSSSSRCTTKAYSSGLPLLVVSTSRSSVLSSWFSWHRLNTREDRRSDLSSWAWTSLKHYRNKK
jgi:hypothetical protein